MNEKERVRGWVKENLIPTEGTGGAVQPYVLKHALQEDTGVYLTLDGFVALLLEMGYRQKLTGSFRAVLSKDLKRRLKKGLVMA